MAQQTFSGVPGAFAAGAVLTAAEQELIRDYMVAQIKEGQTGDTGEVLPMIMDLTNNRIVLDSGGLEFSDATTQTTAAVAGISWSGSTANGLGTYGSSSSIVAESSATYDGTTLALTTAGGGLKLDGLASSNVNTLDDYEEGTATVALTLGSGSVTISPNTIRYTKIGREVFLSGRVTISAVSSPSGYAKFTGLPFTSIAASAQVNYSSDLVSALALTADITAGSTDAVTFNNEAAAWMVTTGLNSGNAWNANLIEVDTAFDFHGHYSTES